MEPDQHVDQDLPNFSAEVQFPDRTTQTGWAVYRIDPQTYGMELQQEQRPDDRIDQTGARLSRPTRHSKTNGQAKIDFEQVESESDRGFSLLAHLDRTGDRTDELIRHFDQFMEFDHPNLSKARIQKLSDDLAFIWSISGS